MKFVHRIADLAESVQHHPDIFVHWNQVTLTVWTHDRGGVTDADFDLIGRIE